MPNRWPVANGNWSNSAIWSGSLIPTASDDVFLNNQTVTLDQTIIVRSIRNTATGSAIVGGLLNIYTDYNIECTTTQSINAGGLDSNGATVTGGFVKYYNSGSINITAHLVAARNTLENINNGTINIIGDVRLPSNAVANCRTITNTLNGTVSIVGDVINGTSTTSGNIAVLNSSNGSIIIVGNIEGGNNGNNPNTIYNNSNGTITVTGNVTGGSKFVSGTTTTAYGIINVSTGVVNVTGNVTGGPAATGIGANTDAIGIVNNSIGTINITGNVTAGTGVRALGINSSTAGIINVIGQLQSVPLTNAISSTSTTATNIFSGPLINSGSRNAIYCYNIELYDDVTTRYTIGVSGSNDTITLFSPDQVTGVPSGSNVRAGIIYGPGNELRGSMRVPHPNSVSWGVPIDNASGSALTKPEDLWNYAVTSLTTSNSIGQRLANTSTSQSMAGIVSSFG
jgi:hypothetical protein